MHSYDYFRVSVRKAVRKTVGELGLLLACSVLHHCLGPQKRWVIAQYGIAYYSVNLLEVLWKHFLSSEINWQPVAKSLFSTEQQRWGRLLSVADIAMMFAYWWAVGSSYVISAAAPVTPPRASHSWEMMVYNSKHSLNSRNLSFFLSFEPYANLRVAQRKLSDSAARSVIKTSRWSASRARWGGLRLLACTPAKRC